MNITDWLKNAVQFLLFLLLVPVIVIAYLIARVVCIGLGFIRCGNIISTGRHLCVPTVFLQNPATGRNVILIGMIHIGKKRFYKKVQKLIDSYPGHKILYESVGRLTTEEEGRLSPDEKKVRDQMTSMFNDRKFLQVLLSLDDQRRGLNYRKTWIRTDIDKFVLLRRFAQARMNFSTGPRISNRVHLRLKKMPEVDRALSRWVMHKLFMILPLMNLLERGRDLKFLDQVILSERNIIGVHGILEHVGDSNIISIWGAAHIPGMVRLLQETGFRKTRVIWFQMYEEPRGLFRKVISAMKKESIK